MTIGDVFARAWDLWRRDVGWLVLAGLVVGTIMATIIAIGFGILAAVTAGAGLAMGAGTYGDSDSLTGLGAGVLGAGALVYMVLVFVIDVLGMTFYGGLFEMVIGAYREQRGVRFGDLFSGFRKFGSYALYALVLFGISLGVTVLNVIPLIGPLIGFVVSLWISILWLYVLPLIADQGVGFGAAASWSSRMIKNAGWWWTFGMVFLLLIAAAVAVGIIVAVGVVASQGDEVTGIALGLLLGVLFAVLFPPYAICYVSVLYVASGGDTAPARAGGGLLGIPPAPPAPSAYGDGAFGAPASPPGPPAPPRAGDDAWRAAADPLAGDDAWRAAADPLAGQTAPPPPEPPTPPAPPD